MSKSQFIVREAKLTDASDIYYINKTSLGYDYPQDKQECKIAAVIEDDSQVIFVAELDGKVIGYIHLADYDVIYADHFKNCLGLAVDINHKRMGVGSALLNRGEEWAKNDGAKGIRLNSGSERADAHKFYFSQGYKENKIQKNIIKFFD